MGDFQNSRHVTARKAHCCEQCGTAIAIGEKHLRVVGAYYGDFYDNRLHHECEAAAHAYARLHNLWGEEWPWFQHQENYWEDWKWMTEEHPLVAKRLGWDDLWKDWNTDDSEPVPQSRTEPASPSQEADRG